MPKQPTEPCQIEAIEAIMADGKPRLVADIMLRLNNSTKGGWLRPYRKQVSKTATDTAIFSLRTQGVLSINAVLRNNTSYLHNAPRVTP
jgi:hypothetical protein